MKRSANARLVIARQGHKLVAEHLVEVVPNSPDHSFSKPPAGGHDLKIEVRNTVTPGANCVCGRRPKTLVCILCKMFTFGRVAEKCPEHRNVTFLMDFINCPNCLGPNECLHGVDIDYNKCQGINSYLMTSPNKYQNLSSSIDEYNAKR